MGLANLTPLNHAELMRNNQLYYAQSSAIAGAYAPVADLPTTTAAVALYNANTDGSGKCFIVDQIHVFLASGTAAAAATAFAGITPLVVVSAQAPVAHGSSLTVVSARAGGPDASGAFFKDAVTIPTTKHFSIGSNLQLAAANLGQGVLPYPIFAIIPPRFALSVGVLSGTGTTPLYAYCIRFAVLPLDLSPA